MTDGNDYMSRLYTHLWDAHFGGDYAILDRSLRPRSFAMMYDVAAAAGLIAHDLVLDVGCGPGGHSRALAQRFGCRVAGLDLVSANLVKARSLIAASGLSNQVSFVQAGAGSIPFRTQSFDMIWCRDMLVHVPDLETTLIECRRILKPGKAMVLLVTFATDLLGEAEAKRLFRPLGIVNRNLSAEVMERAITQAGFSIVTAEDIGGEHLEFIEEREGRYSKELLRLARMLRAKDGLSSQLGDFRFDIALSLYYWSVYLLIGKLTDVIYTLRT